MTERSADSRSHVQKYLEDGHLTTRTWVDVRGRGAIRSEAASDVQVAGAASHLIYRVQRRLPGPQGVIRQE
ncbi:hypothetical protein CCMA1212_004739 [Trichoderma ghanense]|uniref:Uncharacterized protein n=1 Tax=Trichoderma ghanense TaxID=65468 RepID=A0ABY2H4N2_9HYPO